MGVLIAFTWVVVAGQTFPRAVSGGVADYGFFTAIAERLRVGDALYVTVWDNKDPFVFFFLAVARSVGPNGVIGAWLLELAWVVLATVALFFIAARTGVIRSLAALVAFVLAPFVILGMPYFMGSTHLPGVALVLVALALVFCNRPLLAGITLGVLLFFKLVMLPMAIVTIVTAIIVIRSRRGLGPLIFGFIGASTTISILLIARGEFIAFLDTQIHNVLYSQAPIVSAEYVGFVQKIAQHVVILVNPHIAGVILVTVIIGLVTAPFLSRNSGASLDRRGLWWSSAAAFSVGVVSIAASGKWFHHAEILAVSSTLALTLLVGYLSGRPRYPAAIRFSIALAATVLLAGAPPLGHFARPLIDFRSHWTNATTVDMLTRVLMEREPASVAFIGESVPQAAGLERWSIACRHVAQRPFNPEEIFIETLKCLPSSEVIVITRDFESGTSFPAFDSFIAGVNRLVSRDYSCEKVESFRICTRK